MQKMKTSGELNMEGGRTESSEDSEQAASPDQNLYGHSNIEMD